MFREILQRSKQLEIFRFLPRISYFHHNGHGGSYPTGLPCQNGNFYSCCCCDCGIEGFEPTIRNLRAGLEPARTLDGLRAGPGVLLGFRLGSRRYPEAGRLDPGESPVTWTLLVLLLYNSVAPIPERSGPGSERSGYWVEYLREVLHASYCCRCWDFESVGTREK